MTMQTPQTHTRFYLYRGYRRLTLPTSQLILNTMKDSEEAPPEVHHYQELHEVPWDIQK